MALQVLDQGGATISAPSLQDAHCLRTEIRCGPPMCWKPPVEHLVGVEYIGNPGFIGGMVPIPDHGCFLYMFYYCFTTHVIDGSRTIISCYQVTIRLVTG